MSRDYASNFSYADLDSLNFFDSMSEYMYK